MSKINIALLQSRPDFAKQLAELVEYHYPSFNVDPLVQPRSRTERVRQVIQGDYDLIQVDETFRAGLTGALVSRMRDIPLVLYFRGWGRYTNESGEYSLWKQPSIAICTRFCVNSASEIAYISNITREKLKMSYDIPEGVITTRPFDVGKFSNVEPKDGKQANELKLLTVTNLRYSGKLQGVIMILEALKPIFSDYTLTYSIAGNGRYFSELNNYLNGYQFEDRVNILGYHEDVPHLLQEHDVFIYVSFIDSLSMAVLEAQAAGLPVVAGDAVGVPEAVGDGGLVCSTSANGLQNGIRDVVEDSELRTELSRKATSKISEHNKQSVDNFVSLWKTAIS